MKWGFFKLDNYIVFEKHLKLQKRSSFALKYNTKARTC